MNQVFVDVGVSLDGNIAGPNRRAGNPLGDGGPDIHQWMFQTATFRERLGMAGGESSERRRQVVGSGLERICPST